jgi:hypothetical protein
MTGFGRLEVSAGNIENYTLVLRQGMTIPGQIYLDGEKPETFKADAVQMELTPMDNLPIGSTRTRANADGTFTMQNVAPGRYRLKVTASSGAYAARALFGGSDALNEIVQIEGDSTPLQILVGFTQGRIDASVEHTGRPFPNARVILAPQNRSRLDLFKVGSSDKDGKVSFSNVAPGNYKLFAWESLAKANAYQDPRFLEAFEDHGRPISVQKTGTVNEDHLQVMGPVN